MVAIGQGAGLDSAADRAAAIGAIAIGQNAKLWPSSILATENSIAIGNDVLAGGIGTILVGPYTRNSGSYSIAIGARSFSTRGVVIGTDARGSEDRATALGTGARATTEDSVALGSRSVANRGNSVSVGSNEATSGFTRQITNMAAGTADNDAVNLAQLKGTAQSVADAIGGGSAVGADGTITAPTYNVGGVDRDNLGDALTNLDQRATDNSDGLKDLGDKLADSGLVDASGNMQAAVVYDRNTDGTPNYGSVTFGNAGSAPVQLKNVAAGTAGTDAVNLDQLTAASKAAATANPYIGGRGTGNAAVATSTGAVALGINSVANGLNTVSVGNASTGLVRRITNVGDGTEATDAATVGQMNDLIAGTTFSTKKAIADVNAKISAMGSMGTMAAVEDSYLKIDANAGDPEALVAAGTNAVAIGSGATSTGSFSTAIGASSEATGSLAVAIGGEAKATANGTLALGTAEASGTNAVALGNGTHATGNNSVANGFNARAAGTNALAMGNTSSAAGDNAVALGSTSIVNTAATNGVALGRGANVTATGLNSVALGAGSTADRANVVSVGSTAQQRQIANLAAGTAKTDAVNVGQLEAYVAANAGTADPLAVAYTDATKGEIALAGTDGTVISGVKAGEVSATSDEAINGAQLHGTAQSVADAIGGGSAVAADGTISAPSFDIDGTSYANVCCRHSYQRYGSGSLLRA
ncbi:hypothetical protein RZA67_13640 [Stenotrophomonas sp. C3(2023)]|nr:hypothetical protein [Stenotrophomonas sp. C3(2023)]